MVSKETEKLTKAKYIEWQASLFGACFISFGLGGFLASYFLQFAPIIIILGIVIHGWGMYKIHKRNSEVKFLKNILED